MLLHLRHAWVLDDGPGPVPTLRCTRCGRSKVAGPASPRAEHDPGVVRNTAFVNGGRPQRPSGSSPRNG